MKNDKNAERPDDSAETRVLTRSERAAKRNAVRMAADEPSTSAMTVEVHDVTANIIWLNQDQPGPSNAKRESDILSTFTILRSNSTNGRRRETNCESSI